MKTKETTAFLRKLLLDSFSQYYSFRFDQGIDRLWYEQGAFRKSPSFWRLRDEHGTFVTLLEMLVSLKKNIFENVLAYLCKVQILGNYYCRSTFAVYSKFDIQYDCFTLLLVELFLSAYFNFPARKATFLRKYFILILIPVLNPLFPTSVPTRQNDDQSQSD